MIVRLETIAAVRENAELLRQIYALVLPSYVELGSMLERELENNTHAYLAFSDSRDLLAFFFVGWNHPCLSVQRSIVYLGLSACQEERKGSGLTIRLYQKFIHDARQTTNSERSSLLLWATTAHPLIFQVIHRIFVEVNPRLDGTYSEQSSRYAIQLQRAICGIPSPTTPFLLRSFVKDTRYTKREVLRCNEARSKLDFDVFHSFDLREENGDRLLILAELPAHKSINEQ